MVKLKLELPDGFLDEEVRCNYTVSRKMKEVWAVELDLLNEFMRVCKKHNIKFYADGGTAIGCVRHNGFIPWDDDIDLAVSRKDYEKLCQVSYEFKYPYFFQTEQTDPGSCRGHIQLRNSETTGILKHEANYRLKFNQGIFIDIFPKDNIPDDDRKKDKYIKKVVTHKDRLYNYIRILRQSNKKEVWMSDKNKIKTAMKLLRVVLINKLKIVDRQYKKYERLMSKYKDTKTKRICNLPMTDSKNIDGKINSADFLYENPVSFKFEFMELPVPSNYDKILTETYGDYMKYVIGKNTHGDVIFDTSISYIDYFEKEIN